MSFEWFVILASVFHLYYIGWLRVGRGLLSVKLRAELLVDGEATDYLLKSIISTHKFIEKNSKDLTTPDELNFTD